MLTLATIAAAVATLSATAANYKCNAYINRKVALPHLKPMGPEIFGAFLLYDARFVLDCKAGMG